MAVAKKTIAKKSAKKTVRQQTPRVLMVRLLDSGDAGVVKTLNTFQIGKDVTEPYPVIYKATNRLSNNQTVIIPFTQGEGKPVLYFEVRFSKISNGDNTVLPNLNRAIEKCYEILKTRSVETEANTANQKGLLNTLYILFRKYVF
jgi:hypothetical protein